jgi:hypothetical protein
MKSAQIVQEKNKKKIPRGLQQAVAERVGCSISAVYKTFKNPTKSLCDYRVKKMAIEIAEEYGIPEHVYKQWFKF